MKVEEKIESAKNCLHRAATSDKHHKIERKEENESTGGTCKVRIDDFLRVWIEFNEHFENEFAATDGVTARAVILGEIVDQVRMHYLLFEKVLLVQE